MSPDSALGAIAQRVARLEQRVEDLMERVIERFAGVADDVRVFAPLIREHDEMRAEMRFVRESVTQLLASQGALEKRFEEERAERIKGQEKRRVEIEAAREERNLEIARLEAAARKQNEEMQIHADKQRLESRRLLFGLVGIFLSSAAVVIAPLLGGGVG
jgi:hypothetical protein